MMCLFIVMVVLVLLTIANTRLTAMDSLMYTMSNKVVKVTPTPRVTNGTVPRKTTALIRHPADVKKEAQKLTTGRRNTTAKPTLKPDVVVQFPLPQDIVVESGFVAESKRNENLRDVFEDENSESPEGVGDVVYERGPEIRVMADHEPQLHYDDGGDLNEKTRSNKNGMLHRDRFDMRGRDRRLERRFDPDMVRRQVEAHREKQRERKVYMELQSFLDNEKEDTETETENTNGEIRHVFFLKVHKAASTTVMNVLYRFALKRHLNVMLPRHGNVLSEGSKNWIRNVLPLPMSASHYDILCNHLVFNEAPIRSTLPSNTKFIGVVREPFQQFLSAFVYYRNKFRIRYLVRIYGSDPIATYLQDPKRFERSMSSYTHNRMSFDFGMDPRKMKEASYVTEYVNYLNKTFDLVLVSERFDESMVMLKRLLGWRLQDVLYIKNNVFNKQQKEYSPKQKEVHKKFNAADYALYDHFSRLFQKKVEAEGRLFAEEVSIFVSLRQQVEKFCAGSTMEILTVTPTAWTATFEVSRTDCLFMQLSEVPFVSLVRHRQYGDLLLRMRRVRYRKSAFVP